MRFLIASLLLFLPQIVWAFPEMVRHGYTNCIACHTSHVGGNLLNEYGRSLSREILSQPTIFGRPTPEGDEQFGWFIPTPKWLLAGGDVRVLQAFVESKQHSRARFMIMQVDLDASAQLGSRWRAFASLGRIEPVSSDPVFKDFVTSPRHGLEYLFTSPEAENRVTLRAGRFMPAYGILFPEHTFVTRSLLNFNPSQERYAAELAWNNDSSSIIVTGITAEMLGNDTREEKGGTIQLATALGKNSKIGVNYYQSNVKIAGIKSERKMYGLFSHISFSEHWYGLFEVDQPQRADKEKGLVEIFKLGFEVHQGWHLVAVQEFANLNIQEANPKFESYGIGTQWFPRPHWDFYMLLRQERNTAGGNSDFQQAAWLIGHFYL